MDAPQSRAQALAAGRLIDVTEIGRQVGFQEPVAMTAALWADVQDVPPHLHQLGSVERRVRDILYAGRCMAHVRRWQAEVGTCLVYNVGLWINGRATPISTVCLAAERGDANDLVLTVMKYAERLKVRCHER